MEKTTATSHLQTSPYMLHRHCQLKDPNAKRHSAHTDDTHMYSLYNINTLSVRMKPWMKQCTTSFRLQSSADPSAQTRRPEPDTHPNARAAGDSGRVRGVARPRLRRPVPRVLAPSIESVYFYRVERGPRSTPRAPLLGPAPRPRPRGPPFRICTLPAPPGILRTRFSTRRL